MRSAYLEIYGFFSYYEFIDVLVYLIF